MPYTNPDDVRAAQIMERLRAISVEEEALQTELFLLVERARKGERLPEAQDVIDAMGKRELTLDQLEPHPGWGRFFAVIYEPTEGASFVQLYVNDHHELTTLDEATTFLSSRDAEDWRALANYPDTRVVKLYCVWQDDDIIPQGHWDGWHREAPVDRPEASTLYGPRGESIKRAPNSTWVPYLPGGEPIQDLHGNNRALKSALEARELLDRVVVTQENG